MVINLALFGFMLNTFATLQLQEIWVSSKILQKNYIDAVFVPRSFSLQREGRDDARHHDEHGLLNLRSVLQVYLLFKGFSQSHLAQTLRSPAGVEHM